MADTLGRAALISEKLQSLEPSKLDLVDESAQYEEPGKQPQPESHFKVFIACKKFAEMKLFQRHMALNDMFADELAGPLKDFAIEVRFGDDNQDDTVALFDLLPPPPTREQIM